MSQPSSDSGRSFACVRFPLQLRLKTLLSLARSSFRHGRDAGAPSAPAGAGRGARCPSALLTIQDYRLEPATPATVAACIELAEAAQWPEVATKGSALELSEGVVAVHIASGKVVGCCQYWRFGETHASIGFMLVLDAHRSVSPAARGTGLMDQAGLGRRIFRAVIEQAGPHRRFELTATPAGLPLYRTEQFVGLEDCLCLTGTVERPAPVDDRYLVRDARPDELAACWALDERAGSGRSRHHVLDALAKLGRVVVHADAAGRIDAFAVHALEGSTLHIGPVVASDDGAACAVVAPGLQPGTPVWLDTIARTDDPLPRMLLSTGLTVLDVPAIHCVHMVRGALPVEVEGARIFALGGLALG